MKRKLLLLLALTTLGLGPFGAYRYWVKEATLTVANTSPSKMVFFTYSSIDRRQSIVSERQELGPGENREFVQQFWGVEPNFAVFAYSNEPELTRRVRKLPKNHPGIVYYQDDVPDEKLTFQHVTADLLDKPVITELGADVSNALLDNLVDLPFVKVMVDPSSHNATFQVKDETFHGLYSPDVISSKDQEIAVLSARAKLLASALHRQISFSERWPNPNKDFPYGPGLVLHDDDPFLPGLIVEETAPRTIRGDSMPILPGDILFSFGGRIVFGMEDLGLTLFEHATALDKGIDVPIAFEVIREGKRFSGQTMYFFNAAYWGYSDSDRSAAALYGFGDGVTLGHVVGIKTAVQNGFKFLYNIFKSNKSPAKTIEPFREEVWRGNQYKARLRQMYSKEFDGGSFVGMFCPGPGWFLRGPLARALARAGTSRVMASLGAAATIEVAEGIVWTVADSSPLQNSEEITADLRQSIPVFAGAGIAFGSLNLRRSR